MILKVVMVIHGDDRDYNDEGDKGEEKDEDETIRPLALLSQSC